MTPGVKLCVRCGVGFGVGPGLPPHVMCPGCRVPRTCLACAGSFFADDGFAPLCWGCRALSPRAPRPCRYCGEVFELGPRQNSLTKTCPQCMARRRARVCPTCGQTFVMRANQTTRRYCSPGCWARS